MLKIDGAFVNAEIFIPVQENEKTKKAYAEFEGIIDKLQHKDKMALDSAVNQLVTVTTDTAYEKGFRDGLKFLMDAVTDKEILEI